MSIIEDELLNRTSVFFNTLPFAIYIFHTEQSRTCHYHIQYLNNKHKVESTALWQKTNIMSTAKEEYEEDMLFH